MHAPARAGQCGTGSSRGARWPTCVTLDPYPLNPPDACTIELGRHARVEWKLGVSRSRAAKARPHFRGETRLQGERVDW